MPPGKRPGPAGQAREVQPGPQATGTGELPSPGGPSQREQHCHARRERGDHPGGHRPQPQHAQAQAHPRQHGHTGTAFGEPDAAPAPDTTGRAAAGAHGTSDEARATPRPALPVPPARWAKLWSEGLAAACAPARPARAPLPPPAAVHPAARTATAASSAPARSDRARTCQVVIAPSRHGSGGIPLTHPGRDRFPPGVRSRRRPQEDMARAASCAGPPHRHVSNARPPAGPVPADALVWCRFLLVGSPPVPARKAAPKVGSRRDFVAGILPRHGVGCRAW
jgi:hypothetical protein